MTRSWSAGRRSEWSSMEKTAWSRYVSACAQRLPWDARTWGWMATFSGAVEVVKVVGYDIVREIWAGAVR
jgi:hypothetical protein